MLVQPGAHCSPSCNAIYVVGPQAIGSRPRIRVPLLVLVGIEGEACEGFVHVFPHSLLNKALMGPLVSHISKNQGLSELTYCCPIWYVKTNVRH